MTSQNEAGTELAGLQKVPTTARGRRTRSLLIDAARELFEERGFRETRIADIAERAQLSYGTFYHYFDSKEAILQVLFTAVAGDMFTASRMRPETPHNPIARINATNRQYFAVARRNARLIAVVDEMAVRDNEFRSLKLQLRDLFLHRNESGIRKLQEAGFVRPDLNARIAASALGGMLEHFTQLWFIHGVQFIEEDAIRVLTQLWAQALGLEYPDQTAIPWAESALH